MNISLISRSKGLCDAEVQTAIRAVNRQIAEDFEPYWSFGAKLRLEGAVGKRVNHHDLTDMRGDAILYLVDEADESAEFGWHDSNYHDIPYGFVFLDLCREVGENWTVTLSHEALELVGDPLANLMVQGPSPLDRRRKVFHMFEMCDAVQSESYWRGYTEGVDRLSTARWLADHGVNRFPNRGPNLCRSWVVSRSDEWLLGRSGR